MPHLLRTRLSARLTALFLVAGLLPVLGLGWAALVRFERSVLEGAQRRQEFLGRSAGRLTLDAVESADQKLVTLARLLAQEFLDSDLGALQAANADFREAVVTRVSGLVEPSGVFLELQYFGGVERAFVGQVQNFAVASEFEGRDGSNISQIEFNRTGPVVGDPVDLGRPHRDTYLARHAGQVSLRLSQPVREPTGRSGALVGYVDFAELCGTLARLCDQDVELELWDGDGTSLTRVGQVRPPYVESTSAFDAGWVVRVRESRAAVRAPIADLRRRALPWLGGAAGLALGLGLLFAAWITRPVTRLRRAAEALEAGDLGARAGVDRPDEIGRLGAAFDRMAAALAQLDAAKSEFVATVSHELRTPLTSLRLTVANLLDGVQGQVSGPQRAALERVGGELTRLSRLIDDLLELARIEAGVAAPRSETLDLRALAAAVTEVLAPTAAARPVTLVVEGQGGAQADPGMLRRVLTNLIDNAIKFSPPGGTVTVRVSANAFEVADTGPGVTSDDVFEEFHQGTLDGVAPAGAGLGLAIVRKLAELHGGTVAVRNDGGAVFRVEVP